MTSTARAPRACWRRCSRCAGVSYYSLQVGPKSDADRCSCAMVRRLSLTCRGALRTVGSETADAIAELDSGGWCRHRCRPPDRCARQAGVGSSWESHSRLALDAGARRQSLVPDAAPVSASRTRGLALGDQPGARGSHRRRRLSDATDAAPAGTPQGIYPRTYRAEVLLREKLAAGVSLATWASTSRSGHG